MWKKIYSYKSDVEKLVGKIESVSRLGNIRIDGRKVHCSNLKILMILREMKKIEGNIRLLVHRESGHFFGRYFKSHTLIRILKMYYMIGIHF